MQWQELVNTTYLYKFLFDGSEKGDSGLDLVLGIGRFDGGGHHRDEPAFGRHLVSVADHGDVDVGVAADLGFEKKPTN